MQYRTLGHTGVQVSSLALGAMNFGRIGRTTQEQVTAIVDAALASGINLIDTADVYSGGGSEEMVGKAIKGRRDDIVLATKARLPMADDPHSRGSSRRWLVTELDNSLRRLGVDHVDLYQVHRWDPTTSDERLMNDLLSFSGSAESTTAAGPSTSRPCSVRSRRPWPGVIEGTGARIERDRLPTVPGDTTLLTMLWQNLVGNAIKFRDPGRSPYVRITAARDGGAWRFTVSDNGIGIGIDSEFADEICTAIPTGRAGIKRRLARWPRVHTPAVSFDMSQRDLCDGLTPARPESPQPRHNRPVSPGDPCGACPA
ncbi:aldo/keto reductase [Actinoplanes sp. DH11]|uniref:aldo/keto reductase n=1 Tax=Actinoplanes sp. DH11 TaxID=2857011 RepID=UPI001E3D5382|nr:aldo/keto reductase [Actinoplanes sp. DH11]